MFPFQISSSYFESEISSSEISSSCSTSAGSASTCSDSDSSISTTSSSACNTAALTYSDSDAKVSTTSSSVSPAKKVSYFFDPSTCKRQSFSLPEKIVYYMAKNPSNAKTFQKLIETCKYFFKVNPVIVVYRLLCDDENWYAYYDINWKSGVGFKYEQSINFKIWVTKTCVYAYAAKVIPLIYKNDATNVNFQSEPMKFEEFLFLAGNANQLSVSNQLVKYETGKTVQFEDIVKNLPKVQSLTFQPCVDGSDVNSNTVTKLLEIEHFKNISHLSLCNVSEVTDVEGMYNYIIENQHITVYLCYHDGISDAYKELVRKYSNLLGKENGCHSRIKFYGMDYHTFDDHEIAVSEDDSTDTSSDSYVSADENEDSLLFPWNTEDDEEWKLPWDKE